MSAAAKVVVVQRNAADGNTVQSFGAKIHKIIMTTSTGMQEGLLTALLLQHVAAPAQLEGGQAVWSGASVGNGVWSKHPISILVVVCAFPSIAECTGAHAAPHQELAPSLQPQGEDEQAAAALADLRSLTGQRARGSPSAGVVKPKRARHG